MKLLLLSLFTIVITDPYSDIRYGEIDVYEYDKEEKKNNTKKKRKKKQKKSKLWCWMCDPPRWLYRK